jgi:hypothetical protein
MIFGMAPLDSLLRNRTYIATIVIVVFHTIANQRASDGTNRGCRSASSSATNLISDNAAGDTAYDCSANTALLTLLALLYLDVFRAANLSWLIHLLRLLHHTQYARGVIKFSGMRNRSCA